MSGAIMTPSTSNGNRSVPHAFVGVNGAANGESSRTLVVSNTNAKAEAAAQIECPTTPTRTGGRRQPTPSAGASTATASMTSASTSAMGTGTSDRIGITFAPSARELIDRQSCDDSHPAGDADASSSNPRDQYSSRGGRDSGSRCSNDGDKSYRYQDRYYRSGSIAPNGNCAAAADAALIAYEEEEARRKKPEPRWSDTTPFVSNGRGNGGDGHGDNDRYDCGCGDDDSDASSSVGLQGPGEDDGRSVDDRKQEEERNRKSLSNKFRNEYNAVTWTKLIVLAVLGVSMAVVIWLIYRLAKGEEVDDFHVQYADLSAKVMSGFHHNMDMK